MKSLIQKISIASLMALLLVFGNAMAADPITEEDITAFKKSCTDDWQKEIKGEVTEDNKRFGANFCDCLTEEFLSFTKNNNKQPTTTETNALSGFCVNKTLLTKTADMLKSNKKVEANVAEETCKQVYSSIEAQLEGTKEASKSKEATGTATGTGTAETKGNNVKIDYVTSRFCKCAATELSTALSGSMESDATLSKQIDKIAENCTK